MMLPQVTNLDYDGIGKDDEEEIVASLTETYQVDGAIKVPP